MSTILFYSGIAVCLASAVGGIIAVIVLRYSKTRLNKQLDAEYGKQRH